MSAPWHLYLIECRNGSLYAGISNDVPRRYAAHVQGRGGQVHPRQSAGAVGREPAVPEPVGRSSRGMGDSAPSTATET